ncbi:hypothetical protein ACFSSA_00535 [Luteolibacter algae]|uniref:Uncharacterized protein n=1 Tax=Luteolibacter algae TaxID=454151 RepID=A0ABW5D2Y4_9BACT
MKKLITTLAVGAFAFVGTAVEADARPHRSHHVPASQVYISGYHHGRPIYTEKYFIGYDCHGHPRYGYRTVSAPRRGYDRCGTDYHRGGGGYRSSGTRVSISFGR